MNFNLIIIDNFYDNPLEVREFALKQSYTCDSYYPGKRSKPFTNRSLKKKFERLLEPFGGKIIKFNTIDTDNGKFQYTTSNDTTWIHRDENSNWGGILFLTPDAPPSSGTGFYRLKDKNMTGQEHIFCRDITKWELVDKIGNVFNRLILFNSKRYHMALDYFGTDINNGRLFQVFFFDTEFNSS